jgi:hypothetical protein
MTLDLTKFRSDDELGGGGGRGSSSSANKKPRFRSSVGTGAPAPPSS